MTTFLFETEETSFGQSIQLLASFIVVGTRTSRPSRSLDKVIWHPNRDVSVNSYARSSISSSSSPGFSTIENKLLNWKFENAINKRNYLEVDRNLLSWILNGTLSMSMFLHMHQILPNRCYCSRSRPTVSHQFSLLS